MDIKKFSIPFFIMIGILASLEILFFIKVLFSDAQGFEWGSVTDWVSALCNVAMASAAAYAALQAKKWLKPKLNQNGLPEALEFLKKNVKPLLNGIVLDPIDDHFIDLISELETVVESHREEVLPCYNRLKNDFPNIKNIIDPHGEKYKITFNSLKHELMWYGYSLKENKENIIEEIFNLRVEYFNISSQKRLLACRILSDDFSERVQKTNVIPKLKVLKIIRDVITDLIKLNNEQTQIYKKLKQLYKELMGDKPAITDFYDIK